MKLGVGECAIDKGDLAVAKVWEIMGELHWYSARDHIRFVLTDGSERYKCSVSITALNDKYRTEDSMEMAFSNFERDRQVVIDSAVRVIAAGVTDDEGFYFIGHPQLL